MTLIAYKLPVYIQGLHSNVYCFCNSNEVTLYFFSQFRFIYLAEFTNNKIPTLPYCDYAYNLTVINTYADQLSIKKTLNFSNVSFSTKFIQSYKRRLTTNGSFSLSEVPISLSMYSRKN